MKSSLPTESAGAGDGTTKASDPSSQSGSAKPFGLGGALLFNLVIPVALLVAAGLAVFALGKVASPQKPPLDRTLVGRMKSLPSVRVERVRSLAETGASLFLNVDGTVVPYREVQLASEVSGRIITKSPECEAGKFVKANTELIRIDPTDYQLELNKLETTRQQEYAAIDEIDQQVENTKLQITNALEDVRLQQNEFDRLQSLPANFASRGELDQAARALLQSRQSLLGFQNQIKLLGKSRERAKASKDLVSAQINAAQKNLDRCTIVAPIDGVIVSEDAELNTFISRGASVVTMEDTSKVEIATSLRMDQLYWVLDQRARNPAGEIALENISGYELPETDAVIEFELSGRSGTVWRWSGRLLGYDGIGLDPRTRTVPVKVVVDEPRVYADKEGKKLVTAGPTALVRGMFVKVRLKIQPKTPLVVVPARCLRPGNRVWAFTPDDSVLTEPALSDEQLTGDQADAQRDIDAELMVAKDLGADTTESFDVTAWTAGKVSVIRDVVAVDTLTLVGSGLPVPSIRESDETGDGDDGKLWICEVPQGKLPGGAFVVSSPLGSVNTESVNARASTDSLKTSTSSASPVSAGTSQPAKTMASVNEGDQRNLASTTETQE